jgi:hypothetical protein
MPRTEISRRSWVGALTAWPGLSPLRRAAFAGAHEILRYLSAAVYSSLFAERGLPGRSARRYVHSRLWSRTLVTTFGFYIALIFIYLWISGHCAATAAPAPTSKPKNNSFFTISPPYCSPLPATLPVSLPLQPPRAPARSAPSTCRRSLLRSRRPAARIPPRGCGSVRRLERGTV